MKNFTQSRIPFYIFLSLLLFFEDLIFIGPISLSNLWKILAFIFSILIILKKKVYSTRFLLISFIFSLSFLINVDSIISSADIEEIILTLILPVSYYLFYLFYNGTPLKLKKDLILLAGFLILSSIPFIFNIIEPLESNFSESRVRFTESYNFNENILVGFFKQPSISSKVFLVSSVIILSLGLFDFSFNKLNRIFFFGIALIGVYAIYLSFTRTAWLLFIIYILLSVSSNLKLSISKKILSFGMLFLVFSYTYNSNQAIQNRILGVRSNSYNYEFNYSTLSSGRDIVFKKTINALVSEGNLAFLIGLGSEYGLNKTKGTLAHNQFLSILFYGGLISLIFYFLILHLIYREIKKRKSNSPTYKLCMILYILMIFSMIPSHGFPIWANILFGGVIALNRIEYQLNSREYLNI